MKSTTISTLTPPRRTILSLAATIACAALLSALVAAPPAFADESATSASPAVGAYLQVGSYNEVPVTYRVIDSSDVDGDGTPELMLFADKIIKLAPFDAAGDDPGGRGGTARKGNGSNYWPESSLREWLSSDEQSVSWTASSPRSFRVWNGLNPYAGERGFMADGNMTSGERDLVVPVTHTSLISSADESVKTGGDGDHTFVDSSLSAAVTNAATARFATTTDSVFLPSITELKTKVRDRWGAYVLGTATSEALAASNSPHGPADASTAWQYWTRDAFSGNPYSARFLSATGTLPDNGNASAGTRGVRPAMYIRSDIETVGAGTAADPYRIEGLDDTPLPVETPTDQHGNDEGIFAVVRNADLTSDAAERAIASPAVDGITYYTGVSVLMPTQGTYNWDYLDEAIALARKYDKPLKLGMLGGRWVPTWFYDVGVEKFEWALSTDLVDPGLYDAVAPVPWDTIYLDLMEQLVGAAAARYADDPTLMSVQVTGPALSSGLETNLVLNDTDVARIGFEPATYIAAWHRMIDVYAAAFPDDDVALALNNYITQARNNEIPRELRDYAASVLGERFRAEIAYVTYESWFERGNEGIEIWAESGDRIRMEGQLIDLYSAKKSDPEFAYRAIRNAASMGARLVEVFTQDLITEPYATRIAQARTEFLVDRHAALVLDAAALTLDVDATAAIGAALIDRNGFTVSGPVVSWTSSRPEIAAVDASGAVTAVATGITTITATEADGTSATVEVEVVRHASLMSLPPVYVLEAGSAREPSVYLFGRGVIRGVGDDSSYRSSDEQVATIDEEGRIVASSPGVATIDVTYRNLTTRILAIVMN